MAQSTVQRINISKLNNTSKTAADWVRQLRFSPAVNKSTVGVQTDRVTPDLLLKSSSKLLAISRDQQQDDKKDSLQYQRIYGPVEYFAQRVQKDGGNVARSLLWKATNKGNLDFMPVNSLQPHVRAVFNDLGLSNFIDNTTPLDGIDNSMKLTRVGQGGISSQDVAPIQMRLVQPSYYGYVDSCRCYADDTQIYTKQGWISVKDMTEDTQFACLIDNHVEWHKPESVTRYEYEGPMYGFQNQNMSYLVSPGHRMYVQRLTTHRNKQQHIKRPIWGDWKIKHIQQVHGKGCRYLSACDTVKPVDETVKWFHLPKVELTGAQNIGNVDQVNIVDFASFLGWYIAEGCCDSGYGNWAGKRHRVKITQDPRTNPENYTEIRDLLARLPFGRQFPAASQAKGIDFQLHGKQIYSYCKQFGKSWEKFIPQWIFNAPTQARWAFVTAILKGDGSQQRHLNTISKQLALDMERLLFQLGQSVRVTKTLQKWQYKSRVIDPQTNYIYTVVWHKTKILRVPYSKASRKVRSGRGSFIDHYNGFIYCPTVPGGLVYVRRNNASFGIWCGNTAQKSPGITAYMTKNVMKGSDGKLYQKMINMHTGKQQYVDSQTAAASVVTTNQYLGTKDKYVYAMGGDKGIRIVPFKDVDYILKRPDDAYSLGANNVHMLSGDKTLRLNMGCLHPDTPVVVFNTQGYTDIIPAKAVGLNQQHYLMGCDQKGNDSLYPVRAVVARYPDKKRKFRRVVTSSGRVLLTSPDHKWYIYTQTGFKKVKAEDLKPGMKVPRSLFLGAPVRVTQLMGTHITVQICVLLGRLLKSLMVTSKKIRFSYLLQQQHSIDIALTQLGVAGFSKYKKQDNLYCSIQDERFLQWLDKDVGIDPLKRRVPKAALSLPQGYTAALLESFSKQLDNVGEDINGDVWLLDIQSGTLRDGLAFMLSKIYTDTKYRDAVNKKDTQRALQLFPAQNLVGDVVLDTIQAIYKQPNPGMMIDIDCGDNVYACANGIITHNSKYALQAVPLQQRQAPLVQSLDEASGKTMDQIIGKKLGSQWAPKSGIVQAVREDRIDMLYDDGTKGSVQLYKNFPANAKGWLSNYPCVKAGQRVKEGQLLAPSNYTDSKGVSALGRNLRIGYLSYKGGTFQDGCTISQSAAKKMAYTTMYKTGMDLDKTIRTGKSLYNVWKPGNYNKQQMQKLDQNGVIKVGSVINKGDPMILGIQTTEPSPGTMGKRLLTDVSQVWDHAHPGTVTDVVRTRDGVRVYATVSAPLQQGDKISGLHGNKGTVSKILPDEQMPKDSKGRPLQLLFDPLGIVSRCNPAQMIQTALGKVAQKTGKPVVVQQFFPAGQSRLKWAKDLMKQYNVPWKQNVTDPQTGRTISNVFTGLQYFIPLKHISDTKMSGRGTQGYTSEGIPGGQSQQKSKRLGSLESSALVTQNAFNFLTTDAKRIRGQSNHQFWRSLRTGQVPTIPGQPLVHRKFFAHLQGAGMHIRKTTKGVSIMALTNSDVNQLAGNRELKTRDTYQQKTFRPMDGGLFGKDIFGQNGKQWGYIQLDEPLPNPVMQQPLARILRLRDSDFQAIITGTKEVNGMKSSTDMKHALQKINLQKETAAALQELKSASPSTKDAALKRYVALAQIRDNNKRPQDYMLDRIPVLPPQFRPVSTHNGLTMVADSNYLYAQMLDARNDARDAKDLPQQYQQDARKALYRSWKQLVGLYDPQNPKLQSKNVGGLLKWALGVGKSPKQAAFSRKVLGATVDTVGRAVGVPDSRLKLNQVGVPQSMAWGIFGPFVTRKLVQANFTPVDAMKMVKAHSPTARDFLLEVMNQRPVVVNRAPSLHKYNLYGAWPKLVTGTAMHWSPSICDNMSLDADGDSCKSLIMYRLQLPNTHKSLNQSEKCNDLTFSQSMLQQSLLSKDHGGPQSILTMKGEETMFDKGTKMELLHGVMALEDLPTVKGSEVKKSDTVTEWDVQEGYYTNTVDPATGELTWAPITKLSKHENLEMVDVLFSVSNDYAHMVTCSTDHSLITLNPMTLELEKSTPAESIGRCVPMAMRNVANGYDGEAAGITEMCFPSKRYPTSYELGMFIGLMVGDGWVVDTSKNADGTQHYGAHIACCEKSLQNFILELSKDSVHIPFTKQAALFSYSSQNNEQRFSKNDMQRFSLYMEDADKLYIRQQIGHGAHNKRIPAVCFGASRAHLLGLLCGLLATDGSVGYTRPGGNKKTASKAVKYTTVSPLLRDGVQELAHRLGVKTSVKNYKGSATGSNAYDICFCLEDIVKLYDTHPSKFIIPVESKQDNLMAIVEDIHKSKAADGSVVKGHDNVPLPYCLMNAFSWAEVKIGSANPVTAQRGRQYVQRSVAKRLLSALQRRDLTTFTPVKSKGATKYPNTKESILLLVEKWAKIVNDTDIGWEVVDKVTPSECTEGWDCTVPGPYTFSLNTGTIVQDTLNIHVPVSKKAVQEVIDNMMPQRMAILPRSHKAAFMPQKSFMQGIYVATRMGETKGEIKTFADVAQAKKAYREGIIDIDTPIRILK